MNKKLLFITFIVLIILSGFAIKFIRNSSEQISITEKIYVAVEGTGELVVIDPAKQSVIKRIDLSENSGNSSIGFMPHNVQVAPDGKSVWITANAMDIESHNEHSQRLIPVVYADEGHDGEKTAVSDQVIVINPETDLIVKRISLAPGLHLSHVVVTPDSSYAIVAAQEQNKIFKINTATFAVEQELGTTPEAAPHGLRVTPDGKTAYIAMLNGKSLGVLNIESFSLTYVPLEGAAVQTGVTPDGKYAVVSVYDTKSLGVYDIANKTLLYVRLPQEAKGPVQMYPTPDSRYVYVADQGYYFNQPNSDMVYKIDLKEMKVIKGIKAGTAPHGVVVSKDGKRVYVTNLLSEDISVIDTVSDQQTGRIKVGKQPNGISLWSKDMSVDQQQTLNSEQDQWETKIDEEPPVTIEITPVEFGPTASQWKFNIIFSTHSENLDFDPMKIASMADDKGNVSRPIAWEGPGPGGHHREGILVFNPVNPASKYIELKINNVGGIAERSFRWNGE